MSQAITQFRKNIDRMFDKNLTDLIRGLRNNKDNEAKYVAACIDEIKHELRQDSMAVKANAVEKLAYLQMLGYNISWASFNVIEVMASTKFTDKRVGYMAGSQCFHDETDVMMLTTNLIRKDLNSTNMYDSGVALGGLACFVTPDLARDLANDVVTLLTASRPYIRKRAVLLLYKIFLKYPDSLRPTFPRLKEKLEDPDPGVQSAAVNVICELARKNPKNYLSLAPVFFKLMTTSSNNWMLIKIIKLFGALVPLEPRLGKKLLEPLTNLINSTSAMSLLYECINTVIAVLISISSGVPGDHTASIQLCVQKLGVLIEDTDQNLKYLGLLAMGRILQTHPKAVQAHKDVVLACLDDKDESIRLRALDLLYGMVNKKNIMEIVKKLMEHVDAAEGSNYRDELLSRIVKICSHNNYQYITNFEWYVSVLVELTKVEGTKHGAMIAEQLQDVAVRVQSIRHFAVSQMALLIENAHLLLAGSAQHRSNVSEVLLAAAWICGEYSEHVRNVHSTLECMLKAKVSMMPGHIQSAFVQNIGKLYSVEVTNAEKEEDWDLIESLDNVMLSKLPQFQQTDHLEAQERACTLLELMYEVERLHTAREKVSESISILFDGELNPVASKAQRKVPVPQGLDLDAWINEPPAESSSSESEAEPTESSAPGFRSEFDNFGAKRPEYNNGPAKKKYEPSKDELKQMREQRRADVESNPYYVKGSPSSQKLSSGTTNNAVSTKQRPTRLAGKEQSSTGGGGPPPAQTSLDIQSPLEIPGVIGLNQYMEQQQSTMTWSKVKKEKRLKKGKKSSKKRASSSDEEPPVVHQVNRAAGDMPEGAKSTDEEDNSQKNAVDDAFKALDVDLDEPLKYNERLPVLAHRISSMDLGSRTSPVKEQPAVLKKEKRSKKALEKASKKSKKSKKGAVGDEDPAVEEETSKVNNLDLLMVGDGGLELNGNDSSAQLAAATQEKVSKKKSKSPDKRAKKDGKKKVRNASVRSEDLVENQPHHLTVRDKTDYEVASGVCTPSKQQNGTASEQGSGGSQTPQKANPTNAVIPTFSAYRPLGESNEHLKMCYETHVSTADANQVAVTVLFTNVGDRPLKQLEFNVLDSLNTKLIRDPSSAQGSVCIPFNLPVGVSNEHSFRFSVQAVNVAQKLRGTVTFVVEREDGVSPEKVDFHLKFPCISFTLPATISSDSFTELLSGGELTAQSSTQFTTEEPLSLLLRKLAFFGHFTVVEEQASGDGASLYSQTIQAQPICLLVKHRNNAVQIDGKSSEQSLVSYVLDELKEIATTANS